MAKSAKGTAKPPADKPPPAVHDHSKQQQPHSVNGGIDKHKSAKSVKRQAPEGAGTNPAAQQRGGKADKHRKTEHSSKPAERAANKQHGAGEHQQSAKNHHKPGDGNSGQPAAHRPTKGPQKPAAKPQPPAPQQPRKPGSNWEALKTQIGATGAGAAKRKEIDAAAGRKPNSRGSNTGLTPVVAMDCEMVGVGPEGSRSALARVAVINQDGNVLLDVFVRPKEKVTDFRTKYSGVRPKDILSEGAVEFEEAQKRVATILKGRMLVGHALTNDLTVLMLDHPHKDIRDTAKYPPLMLQRAAGQRPKPRALRYLAVEELGIDIQSGEHNPVDDARAALYLYLKHKKEWESAIANGTIKRSLQAVKQSRKAAVSAAVAAATGGGDAGADAPTAAAKAALTAGQLRALRIGRKIKTQGGGKGRVAGQGNGPSQALPGAAAVAGAPGHAPNHHTDGGDVTELVAKAASEAARDALSQRHANKRRRLMQEALRKDVRQDPLADL